MSTNKETFKRVRFIACEGDESLLVGRTGLLIVGGERKYTQAGFDSMVLLDERADDASVRKYFSTFAECWFPDTMRWPKEKWGRHFLVEADSALHLEIIGSEEVEVDLSPFISASRIEVRHGTEGPKHDPYSFEEWTLTRGSDTWLIHVGLAEWVKLNGVEAEPRAGGDISDRLKLAGCPFSLREIEKYHARIKAVPLRLHKAHGGTRWTDGMPGETLLICKCGAILDGHFDISAVE